MKLRIVNSKSQRVHFDERGSGPGMKCIPFVDQPHSALLWDAFMDQETLHAVFNEESDEGAGGVHGRRHVAGLD